MRLRRTSINDPKPIFGSASGYIQSRRRSILDQTLSPRKGYLEANACRMSPFRPFRPTSHYAKTWHSPESPFILARSSTVIWLRWLKRTWPCALPGSAGPCRDPVDELVDSEIDFSWGATGMVQPEGRWLSRQTDEEFFWPEPAH